MAEIDRLTLQLQEFAALKKDINAGVADIAAGRVKDFDIDRIVEQGKKLLAFRSLSARPTRPR